MDIAHLGKLKPDPDDDEWMISKKTPVPILNGTSVKFILEGVSDDRRSKDFEVAIGNFLQFGEDARKFASPFLLQVYKAAGTMVGSKASVPDERSIWDHIRPQEIHVRRRDRRDKKVYVAIHAECDWDQEHGLQLVFREGRDLNRVSDQDDELTYSDAFDLPESKDRIC